MKANPISIRRTPEIDGSHIITVRLEDGNEITITFDQGQVADTVVAFQSGMIATATKTVKEFGAAIAPLLDSGAGTGQNGPAIQISIGDIGLIQLEASDESLRKLASDINRALEMREDRRKAN